MGTTLVEELEQAAFRADVMAQETTSARAGVRWMHLMKVHMDEAARLRARAKRVAALERPACRGDCEHVDCFLYRALTGPLPATPPETPGDPREKGTR